MGAAYKAGTPGRGELDVTGRLALSPTEAAEALGLSRPSVYGLLNSGQLPSVRAGNRRLIAVAAVLRFLGETT
jgi:excisionase family DNA binding protein